MIQNCYNCGSDIIERIAEYEGECFYNGSHIEAPIDHDLVIAQCRNCGTVLAVWFDDCTQEIDETDN